MMMWRIALAAFLTLCLALLPSRAQFNGCQAGFCAPAAVGGGGGCSQATAFIARTSGLSGTENTATTNLICGMVTDGTYSIMDGLYVFATNTTTTATLNWAQNAFNLTWTSLGNCTFAADSGLTGDGATCFAGTGYTPSSSGGHMTQNSASIGGCVVNSRSASQNYVVIGTTNGANYSYMQPYNGTTFQYDLQGGTFPSFSQGNAQGSWIISRVSSSALALYLNGSSIATPADTSGALIGQAIDVMAFNNNGTTNDFTADKIAYAFFGGGLTSTQAGNVRTRLNTYYTAVGGTGC
jgi:hypothetical protein